MWADDSDEDEERPSRTPARGFSKGPKNYTAPVSFVAGGVQQAGKPTDEKKESEEEAKEENSEIPNSSRFVYNLLNVNIDDCN